mgnify:CR=1 FL=1
MSFFFFLNVTYTPSHNIHEELQQLRNLQNQSIDSVRFAARQQLQNQGAIDLIQNQQHPNTLSIPFS